MRVEDWIDEVDPSEPEEVRCKFCGERDLWWLNKVLVDGEGKRHVCLKGPRGPAKVSEFEVLP